MRKAIFGAVSIATLCTASFVAAQPAPSPPGPVAQPAPPPAPPLPPPPAPPAAVAPAAPASIEMPPPPAALPPAFPAEVPPIASPESEGSPMAAKDGYPLAGYHDGLFFLRSPDDDYRLYVTGRAQIDLYNYFGPGVADTGLKTTLLLRRIRPEIAGEFFNTFSFFIAGDWFSTSLDNPKGTNETSAAPPGTGPSATSGRYASAQTASIRAQSTDVFLIAKVCNCLNFQIGQFDAPFTMENRTSDKYIPFMERSLAVRNVGIPTNKEMGIMVWGETRGKLLSYALGAFNGDGQNKLNPDNRVDGMGRVFIHPLAGNATGALKDLQIGASVRYGQRDPNYVNYDVATMTTQGNYAFWSPVYKGANGYTHVLPSGSQFGFAAELRIPLEMVDLTGEFVTINNHTREAIEGYQATNTERLGAMTGYSYYVQLGFWPMGNRDINGGLPGYENPPHVDLRKPAPKSPKHALQLLAKWEQVSLDYESSSRQGSADAKNIDGKIKVNALSFGANYWATKHLRFTANYVLDMFPGSGPVDATNPDNKQTPDQRAQAPANGLPKTVNPDARDTAHVLHELLFRVAVAF